MKILLDINVLLRSVQRSHSACLPTRQCVRRLYEQGHELCVAPQNVAEFWNVCTRPQEVNGLGLTVAATNRNVLRLERFLLLLPDSLESFLTWRKLVLEHAVIGAKVHDARLAALMRTHRVLQILTCNTGDFARFPGIEALHPDNVM